MGTLQYRVELNPLTKPASYRLRFLPQQTAGYAELAAAVARDNGISIDQAWANIRSIVRNIKGMLSNGIQVTLEDAFTFCPSFHARLNSPDDPLPPLEELLRISITATRPFIRDVRQDVHLKRLASDEKAPVILSAEDTKLKLADVLNPDGVLKLTGSNLNFDESKVTCGCMIEGTQSGEIRQSTYASVSNSLIMLVPDIPAQEELWNNEYTATLITQYSEHGSVRSSTYTRRLRTPLLVQGLSFETGPGILTGAADAPYVRIQSGEGTASEMLRIQAVYNTQTSSLMLNLLGMKENGSAGPVFAITANGTYTLNGFSGSAITSLEIIVDNYSGLLDLVRNAYADRLVDILDIRLT